MIRVKICRDALGVICGFDAENHGEKLVCAAVSILTLNTVNSIEKFTDAQIDYDYNEKGGFLRFRLSGSGENHDAVLLLESMLLGLQGIASSYGRSLHITDEVSTK